MRIASLLAATTLVVFSLPAVAATAAPWQEVEDQDVPALQPEFTVPDETEFQTDIPIDFPTVVDIVVTGLAAHDPEQVAGMLGIKRGEPIPDRATMTAAQNRLYNDYHILVERDGYGFQEAEGGVIVHLRFLESPVDLDPKFIGNVKFKVSRLREWAQLDDRVEVYVNEVPNIAERIREGYKKQGYYFVEVEPRLGGTAVRYREIIFEIREGPKVHVKGVTLKGNEAIPNEGFLFWKRGLKKYAGIVTKGKGLFAWWGHRFDEEVLAADVTAIAGVYRSRGYLDAVVSYELTFTENRSGVHVTFEVDEGPLYHVASVGLKGYEKELVQQVPGGLFEPEYREIDLSIPERELRSLLTLSPGDPYESVRVALDRAALRDRYGEDGYIDAASFEDRSTPAGWDFLTPDVLFDFEKKEVHITYRIQEGRKFFLRFFEVRGNDNTKDHVIRRRFGIVEGERIDAKKLRDGLRRVRATGYFDDQYARGTHPPPTLTYRPVEGEPDQVDATVSVKEGRTINANLSGGVASDQGLVGIISLQINNFDAQRLPRSFLGTFGEVYRKEAFTGDGETFGIDLSPGSQVSYWRVFYSHPDFLRRYFDPIGLLFELQARDRIYRSHDEKRQFWRGAITRAFGQGDVQVSAGLRAQEITTSDLDQTNVLPHTLTNSVGTEQFVGVTASISANKLNNTRLPRSGWSARWVNTVYPTAFGSDSNLWKSEASLDRYFHLSDDLESAAPGVYIGLGAALAVPFNEQSGTVNYGERFFFGGARFGRGFRFRGVGPYEGAYPLGGETFLRSTLEYRFPLYTQDVPGTTRKRELFRASLFVDAGVLNPDAYEVDFGETRISAGFALGLIEPFPVTFSFGWPLISDEADERQVFAFTLTLR